VARAYHNNTVSIENLKGILACDYRRTKRSRTEINSD